MVFDVVTEPCVIRALTNFSKSGLRGRISNPTTSVFRSAVSSGLSVTLPATCTVPCGAHTRDSSIGITSPAASVTFFAENWMPVSPSCAGWGAARSTTSA